MMLDSGVCTIFAAKDGSTQGGMPDYQYTRAAQSWYGLLGFETSPAAPTEYRTERRTDARIRILQHRTLHEDDLVILAAVEELPEDLPRYKITRAYHGTDDDSGELITDLTLEEVRPWS